MQSNNNNTDNSITNFSRLSAGHLINAKKSQGINKLDEIKNILENVMKINILIFALLANTKKSNEVLEKTIEQEKKRNNDLLLELAIYKTYKDELETLKKEIDEYKKKIKILESEKLDLKFELISLKENSKNERK